MEVEETLDGRIGEDDGPNSLEEVKSGSTYIKPNRSKKRPMRYDDFEMDLVGSD